MQTIQYDAKIDTSNTNSTILNMKHSFYCLAVPLGNAMHSDNSTYNIKMKSISVLAVKMMAEISYSGFL